MRRFFFKFASVMLLAALTLELYLLEVVLTTGGGFIEVEAVGGEGTNTSGRVAVVVVGRSSQDRVSGAVSVPLVSRIESASNTCCRSERNSCWISRSSSNRLPPFPPALRPLFAACSNVLASRAESPFCSNVFV